MTAVIERADLTALTDDQLAAAYFDEGADLDAIDAEHKHREHVRQQRRQARRQSQSGWYEAAYQQFLNAESSCAGVLLNAKGISRNVEPFSLWSGSQWCVDAYASWELLRFWETHPRLTVTEYERQQRRERREERDYELDRDDRDGVRQVEGAERKGAAHHRDGTGHVVSAFAARSQAQADDGRASADAGRGAAVRPGVTVTAPARTAEEIRASVAARTALGATSAATAEGGDPHAPRRVTGTLRAPAEVAVREPDSVAVRREDGDRVLRYIYTFLKRFAVWGSEHEIITATLWIAHTHARDGDGMPIWQYLARLGILGPKGSGKSWKAKLIGKLSWSPEILVQPTLPAFIDLCAENNTVIITEADEQFRSPGRSRGILAVINASYEPDRTTSRKQGGVAVKIPLFCHIVLDGIADVLLSPNRPDLGAMMSRCIVLPARIAPDGYRPPRFDRQARGVAEQLSKRAATWMAQEVADGMADDVPGGIPDHLGNRPYSLWEPLWVVAGRADAAMRRRLADAGEEATAEMHPWTDAVTEACLALESGNGLPEETEDAASELDRQMAEWGGEF